MARLVFSSGSLSQNWEAILQDILENGTLSPVGISGTSLSLDYNDMHLVLTGSDLHASASRIIDTGTISGFTISEGSKLVLTMAELAQPVADEFQFLLEGANGLKPGSEAMRALIAPLFTREVLVASGSSRGETILGSSGIDRMGGAGGNDIIIGGDGVDILSGGTGVDMLDYRFDTRSIGIKANLGANTVLDNDSAAAIVDTIWDFENLYGTTWNDVIRGSVGNNKLFGEAGNDAIYGLAGNDGLFGGSGNDVLSGGTGNNFYNGGTGADRFVGGSVKGLGLWDKVSYEFETGSQGIVATFNGGQSISVTDTYGNIDTGTYIEEIKGSRLADTFNGSADSEFAEGMKGNDLFRMNGGSDTVVYQHEYDAGARKGVIVNLSKANVTTNIGSGQVTVLSGMAQDSFGDTDTFRSVENITATRYADYLVGNSSDNLLQGGAGNDVLLGLDGKDVLVGGLGRDVMQGGKGIDVFRFYHSSETGATQGSRDTIRQFAHRVDEIDLKGVDASTKSAGNDDFDWIGSAAFHGIAGELHFRFVGAGTTLLEGDRNGDGKADFVIEFSNHVLISQDDLIL